MTKPLATSTSKPSAIVVPSAFLTLAIPVVALIAALLSGSLLLLNYVHVLIAGTWTGIDLFMGLVMSRVMRGLSPQSRVEIIKKPVPMMLFFMPGLASVDICWNLPSWSFGEVSSRHQ
jgi:zinc transporter ZupT